MPGDEGRTSLKATLNPLGLKGTLTVQPMIVASARRHGVTDEDLLHAYWHPVRVFEQDDGLTMIVGSACDGHLVEVGIVNARDVDGVVIIHGMAARSKFLR